jgi:hypothetical protein
MSDITPETFKPPKPHPLIASLPPHLKDPANYEKVQRVILEALASGHSHGEIVEWAACGACQQRFMERGDVLKKLGFSSAAQYLAWKKVHEEIKARYPLAKYNS